MRDTAAAGTATARTDAAQGLDAPVIETRGLTKRYRGGRLAVDGLDLTVPGGSVFGFLGPNGSGKTTTIRMLMGLIDPTSGTARLLGRPMPQASRTVLPEVGALIEGPALYGYLSGRDNLLRYDSADPTASARGRLAVTTPDPGAAARILQEHGLTGLSVDDRLTADVPPAAVDLAALAATLPVFLPMAVGVVAGDAIAGEASGGTLRYLLVAPAGRTRLLLAKYASVLTFCLVATVVVAASALAVGALLFPVGEVTTISGTRIGFGEGLVRAALTAAVVAASLVGFAALGLFVSTLTDSGIGAMAATVGLLIAVQILDTIPQLSGIHPYLFPHHWMSFADVLREPVHWDGLVKNFQLQGLYAAVFGSAAWARFTTKDITA